MKQIHCGFRDGPGVSASRLLVQYGPTIQVDIGFDPAFDAATNVAPDLPLKGIHALVDTGATDSCIDAAMAMQLNLPIFDQRKVSGVNGTMDVNMHLAQIHIPGLPHTISAAFAGVNLIAGGQPHGVLIGRTFLQHFKLYYDGPTGLVLIAEDLPGVKIPPPP